MILWKVREPHNYWTGAGTKIDSAPNWNYFQVFIGALLFINSSKKFCVENNKNKKKNQTNEQIQKQTKKQHALWNFLFCFLLKAFSIVSFWFELNIKLLQHSFTHSFHIHPLNHDHNQTLIITFTFTSLLDDLSV